MGGLCHNFELEPLGHDLAVSKGVGSKMAEGAGAAGSQSSGAVCAADRAYASWRKKDTKNC